tara:strand:- start:171 stop:599 length:429 start_codon:yes stop_codon:yes gene_type:complete
MPSSWLNYRKAMKQPASNAIIRNLLPLKASTLFTNQAISGNQTMQNDNPNAERYIAIARACLKAINDTAKNSGDREQKIQAVYQAIDSAFQAEFADYRQSVVIMATVLERIASGELDGDKAADLARKTLDQQPDNTRKAMMH